MSLLTEPDTSLVDAPRPVRGKDRIQSLDIIRGVALFGILLMNITFFGMPIQAYSDPSVYGGDTGIDLWTWITTNMLFEGTQRGLFSMLFGAGVILLTSRYEAAGRTDAADIYYRRNIWLIAFGLFHSFLILWLGEILFYYGIAALFLYPMRNLKPKALIAIAVAGLSINAAWTYGEARISGAAADKYEVAMAAVAAGQELSDEQVSDTVAWHAIAAELKPSEEALQEMLAGYQGGYLTILAFQAPLNVEIESHQIYRYFFDFFSMMVFGMAFFKLGILTLERPSRFYWALIVAGYSVGLVVNYLETSAIIASDFSVLAFARAGATYDLGRLAMTTGHVGLLLLFCRSGFLPWLQNGLAAVGRLALTNYVSHSVICAIVFYGFGFGLHGSLARHQLYYVVFSIWAVQLIVSPIWLKHYRFGPLEWLWRSLTYLERQPMRRDVKTTSTPDPTLRTA